VLYNRQVRSLPLDAVLKTVAEEVAITEECPWERFIDFAT
jgi:hypothetical protein